MRHTPRFTACLLVLLATRLPAQEPSAPPFRFLDTQTNAHRTAPIPIALASGKAHLKVAIGDAEPDWLLLDSGANMTILNRAYAEHLGLELRGEMRSGGAAGGDGTYRVAFTDIPSLRLPGLEVDGRTVAVLTRRTQAANGHASHGLLGADVLRQVVVEIDYAASTLTVHDPRHFTPPPGATAIPVRIDQNLKTHIDAKLMPPGGGPDLPVDLVVDTGARGFLTLTRPFVERHGLEARLPRRYEAVVGVGIGGEVRHLAARFPELRVGPFTIPSPPIDLPTAKTGGSFSQGGRDGILGAEFLRRFRVILDLPHERLLLIPTTRPAEPPSFDASGLFVVATGEDFRGVEILAVAPQSPAAEAGLEPGDSILAVDGTPVEHLGLDMVRDLLREAGAERRLQLGRDRGEVEVELRLRELI